MTAERDTIRQDDEADRYSGLISRETVDKARIQLAIRDRLPYLSLEELQQINTIAAGEPIEVPLPEGVASLADRRSHA